MPYHGYYGVDTLASDVHFRCPEACLRTSAPPPTNAPNLTLAVTINPIDNPFVRGADVRGEMLGHAI